MKKVLVLITILFTSIFLTQAGELITSWMHFNKEYSFIYNKGSNNHKLLDNSVNALTKDDNGNIWLGINYKGLNVWNGKEMKAISCNKESFLAKGDILCMASFGNTVYVGTTEGLVKYDGTNFANIDQNTTGLQAVRDIAISPTGKMYISGLVSNGVQFTEGGLSFFNGETWTKFTVASSALPDMFLQDLILDEKNHLWMTVGELKDKGVAKFDGKNWTLLNSATGFPSNDIKAIAKNHKGNIVVASNQGVFTNSNNEWKQEVYSKLFSKKIMTSIASSQGSIMASALQFDKLGTLYLGTQNNGIYIQRAHYTRNFNQQNGLLGQAVHDIIIDNNSNKWMLTGNVRAEWWKSYYKPKERYLAFNNYSGVIALNEFGNSENAAWKMYDNIGFEHDLGVCQTICEEEDGTLWIPNVGSGLLQYQNRQFTPMNEGTNAFTSAFTNMYLAPDKKMYVNTNMSGLKIFQNNRIEPFAKAPNMGGISDLAYDKDNVLWASGMGGLSKYVNNDWETFNKRKGDLPSVIIYALLRDKNGLLWIGTAKGLVKYDGTAFVTLEEKEVEFPSNDIRAISQGADGKMFVGSKKGLSVFNGQTWTHYEKLESLKLKNFCVNKLSIDKAGIVWIASEGDGILKFDGTNWTQYNKENTHSLYNSVLSIKATNDGRVYAISAFNEFGDKPFIFTPSASASAGERAEAANMKKIGDAEPKYILTILDNK